MEQIATVLVTSPQTGAGWKFLPETRAHLSLTVAQLPVPSVRRLAILRAQLSCAALTFTALVTAAAYIFIPLALAVHSAVHPVLLALVIAVAVLIEIALAVTFIILKTEGPPE